ncbi:hypothetical protein [Chitinophaga sp. Cy-1792]|uniref:hypothetical protein n=1 Tax=Chitinophaga sp. Cy-1792 TaxID=2608339 RepID=UPI001420990E|nr:hypothetical protein [Chitinophaga sp. Cy-1792]NIG54676.1 hypothetical protein [Chitinophaga sp. Cy-1792]
MVALIEKQSSYLAVTEEFFLTPAKILHCYHVGSWDVRTVASYDVVTTSIFLKELYRFMSFFPWLEIIGFTSVFEEGYWSIEDSAEMSIDKWFENASVKEESEIGGVLSVVSLSYKMRYEDNTFIYPDNRCVILYISYDDGGSWAMGLDYGRMYLWRNPRGSMKYF